MQEPTIQEVRELAATIRDTAAKAHSLAYADGAMDCARKILDFLTPKPRPVEAVVREALDHFGDYASERDTAARQVTEALRAEGYEL